MDKIKDLKTKRLVFALIALALAIATVVLAYVSFSLVKEGNYKTMWFSFASSAITLYLATFFGISSLNHSLYLRVVSAVKEENTDDAEALEGIIGIKAKALAKIIKKCKKRGYIA